MPVKFPCKISEKVVAGNHNIKCNRINTQTYNILKKENASWNCI